MSEGLTRQLAAFAVAPMALERTARSKLTKLIADCLQQGKCADDSKQTAMAAVLSRLAGPSSEAACWASGQRYQAEWAAFVNAFLASAARIDADSIDASTYALAVVPAGVALCELVDGSMQQLQEAVLTGLEVASRCAVALGSNHPRRGWDLVGTAGVIGVSALSVRLLCLDVEQGEQAMGLAITQAAGVRAQDGTDALSMHAAKAAFNAIEAARLVKQGLDGPRRMLEGRRGLLALASDGPDVEAALKGLGQEWQVLSGIVGGATALPAIFRDSSAESVRVRDLVVAL